MEKRIENIGDIKLLVDTFYARIREDDLLAEIFNDTIGDRWPAHLEKMYRFWQTVLLDQHTYHGAPFIPHAPLPIDKIHFDRWIDIFDKTVDDLFEGQKAAEAKWRAARMAEMFLYKITRYRAYPGTIIK